MDIDVFALVQLKELDYLISLCLQTFELDLL